jgi:phage terminase large subunit
MPTVNLDIEPRTAFAPYLWRKERWACMVVHRRGGKTFASIQDLLLRALTKRRKGPPKRYAYVAPTRDQAKDIAWGYLTEFTGPMPGTKINQQELSVTLHNKASIRLYSGDSYERMRGVYLDGAVIDEPADIDPDAWPSVIRPCLSDYSGWATFIGTPKGQNAFYDRWKEATSSPEWFSMMLKSSESGIIPADELASIRRGTPEHLYRQEFECDFTVPMPGSIYAGAIDEARAQGRVCEMPVDGSSPVCTSWDLGSPENTSVWFFQIVGREIRFIDFHKGDKGTLTERVALMKSLGYNYDKHYLPHDAQQTERTGTTFATELVRAGMPGGSVVTVPRTHDVWVGINHGLEMFNALSFRMPHCVDGLNALASYRTRRQGEGAAQTDLPIHDWASHPSDAARVMFEAHRSGMIKFKHTTAEARSDWYDPHRARRRGAKPIRMF